MAQPRCPSHIWRRRRSTPIDAIATPARGELVPKAAVRFVGGVVIVSALIFLPAGTLDYWQAWVYLAVLFVPMAAEVAYLVARHPALLARRLNIKETHPEQRLIQRLGAACYLATYVVPALDRRYGWSAVPDGATLFADGVVLAGYFVFAFVLRENAYASRVIAVEAGQHVVTTGPYRLVRHPMYLGILLMYVATPLALGSWWGLLPSLLLPIVMRARIVGEEKVLAADLDGYTAYTRRTRYRLVPGVW